MPPRPLPLASNPVAMMEAPLDEDREVWDLVQILQKDCGDPPKYLVAWRRTIEYVDRMAKRKAKQCGRAWEEAETGRQIAEFEWPDSWNLAEDGVDMAESIHEFEAKL